MNDAHMYGKLHANFCGRGPPGCEATGHEVNYYIVYTASIRKSEVGGSIYIAAYCTNGAPDVHYFFTTLSEGTGDV